MNETVTAAGLEHQILGLAGEYAVASELCRRNIYAQLTLGNRKATDLLVDVERGKMLRVQVKAKQKREWPGVKGVSGPSAVLVFVDYESKELHDRPDFYIMTPTDWKSFVLARRKKEPSLTIGPDGLLIRSGPYVGIGLKPEHLHKHREKWDKIKKLLAMLWKTEGTATAKKTPATGGDKARRTTGNALSMFRDICMKNKSIHRDELIAKVVAATGVHDYTVSAYIAGAKKDATGGFQLVEDKDTRMLRKV